MKTPKELQSLKEKIAAIQSGNYDVEAENPKVIKCWERLNCGNTECPAFGKLRCWSIAGTCCHGQVKGELAQKIGDCKKCVVYKESCDDEIGELIESFNLMVKEFQFNIAEQKKISQEEAKTARLSELGDMAAVIAHETRNPLHSIGMAVSYLKKIFQGELGAEFLNIIEEEVEKLNTLVSLFIKFSNPAPLNIEPCALNPIVHKALAAFTLQAEERQIDVVLDLADDLPQVPCDAQRIQESVESLLENAFESISGTGRIQVTTGSRHTHLQISVKDSGAGIASENHEEVFTPFYTTKTHGPGLGLSMLARTAREHNGSVEMCSTEGQGSVFTLLLPLAMG